MPTLDARSPQESLDDLELDQVTGGVHLRSIGEALEPERPAGRLTLQVERPKRGFFARLFGS